MFELRPTGGANLPTSANIPILTNDSMEKNNDYYRELHANLRHYDLKAWTVLASLLVVVGFAFSQIQADKDGNLISFRNAIISIVIGIVCFLLLLKFLKEHAHSIWIQKKINEFDQDFNRSSQEKRVLLRRDPLFSMPSKSEKEDEFSYTKMLVDLKSRFMKDPYFDSFIGEERLIRLPVSKIFIWLIALFSASAVLFGIISLFCLMVHK